MTPNLSYLPHDDNAFMDQFILPSHYALARSSAVRFCVRNLNEQIIICSDDYAKETGYNNFKEIMYKQPDIDYDRIIGSRKYFLLQMNYLKLHKKNFNFIYKDVIHEGFYMSTSEPILNFAKDVIGKKESDTRLKLLSHREIIENHFNKHAIEIAALTNITKDIKLSHRGEIVLFMLIGGYSQNSIGQFMGFSRTQILKIIDQELCPKFGLTITSTKQLIEKAISLGFAHYIPESFLEQLNFLQV